MVCCYKRKLKMLAIKQDKDRILRTILFRAIGDVMQ